MLTYLVAGGHDGEGDHLEVEARLEPQPVHQPDHLDDQHVLPQVVANLPQQPLVQ